MGVRGKRSQIGVQQMAAGQLDARAQGEVQRKLSPRWRLGLYHHRLVVQLLQCRNDNAHLGAVRQKRVLGPTGLNRQEFQQRSLPRDVHVHHYGPRRRKRRGRSRWVLWSGRNHGSPMCNKSNSKSCRPGRSYTPLRSSLPGLVCQTPLRNVWFPVPVSRSAELHFNAPF